MDLTRYRRLIRDGLPGIAQREGKQLDVQPAASTAELNLLLLRKLAEEGAEVQAALAAGQRKSLVDELGDLQAVIQAIGAQAGVTPEEIAAAAERRAAQHGGFAAGLVLAEPAPQPLRLHAGRGTSLLDTLRHELSVCRAARFAVSFVMPTGVDALEGAIRAALLRGAHVDLLTTDYLGVTEPEALRRLIGLPGRIDVRAFCAPDRSFHPKAYLFDYGDGDGRAYVGSANLSRSGLAEGVEWTWAIRATDLGHPMDELFGEFAALFDSEHTAVVSPAWIEAYAARRKVPAPLTALAEPVQQRAPEPRPVQLLALRELARLREEGERRALVVAATGLGKTWLAAFDARGFQRVLFIAHREELLVQAERAFRAVHPHRSVGFVSGERVELDRDFVFATIQTLSRGRVVDDNQLAGFDYVVVDEFHHAAADSYTRVLARLNARFLLGLTATPYRGDNRDLFALCDGNVAYEIRLFQAISLGWLSPFRYFGVADTVEYEAGLLNNSRTGYDERRLTERFRDPVRTELILDHYRRYRGQAALGFCVSIDHAQAMADAFCAAGVVALALHSRSAPEDRATAITKLETGALDIIFTVDLFNEGVDIPCVDLVMFLRPTESMTVFLQQLGRGLRLHPGKDRLTVVDLIGNHRNAQRKLPFLVGLEDDSPDRVAAALAAVKALSQGERPATLPDGVEVELEELAIAHLERALRAGSSLKEQLAQAYVEVRQSLGRRPTLSELEMRGRFSSTHYLRRSGWGSWYGALQALDTLNESEAEVERSCGRFLAEIEGTALNKSYKLVVLAAMLERQALPGEITLGALVEHFREHFSRDAYRLDVSGTRIEDVRGVDAETLGRYILDNPINAWVGGNTRQASPWFRYDATWEVFRYIGPQARDRTTFVQALRERIDHRLLHYRQRAHADERTVKVIPNGTGACIMLGRDRGDRLPRGAGWQLLKLGDDYYYMKFANIAINAIKRQPVDAPGEPNVIVEVLKRLFEDERLLEFRRAYRLSIVRTAEGNAWTFVVASG